MFGINVSKDLMFKKEIDVQKGLMHINFKELVMNV